MKSNELNATSHAGGDEKLIIYFAWPKMAKLRSTMEVSPHLPRNGSRLPVNQSLEKSHFSETRYGSVYALV